MLFEVMMGHTAEQSTCNLIDIARIMNLTVSYMLTPVIKAKCASPSLCRTQTCARVRTRTGLGLWARVVP
jgi:hypothetical protein